jgi:hypothetical protein
MKHLKMLAAAAVAAMALMGVAAGSASATTLAINHVPQTSAVTITASLTSGTTATLKTTDSKTLVDTCSGSHVHGTTTSPFTGATVTGNVESLAWEKCSHTTDTIAGKGGKLHITTTSGGNGTVTSSGAEVTVKSTTFGVSVVCKTGEGTHIGTFTGAPTTTGHAEMDIDATVDCGLFSAKWEGTYIVTSPTGLTAVS